jgi:predicted KAP-like P-loop ATPase
MKKELTMFKSDDPIKTSSEDILGRSKFAISFAESLLAYEEKKCLVTAVYGPWGTGKSSLINLILEQINTSTKSLGKNQKPIIVRFNPWNYSDQNQLTAQYFKELSIALRRKDYGVDARKAGQELEVYAQFFTPVLMASDPSFLWLIISMLQKLLRIFAQGSQQWGRLKQKGMEDVKIDLEKILSRQKRKIIVIIDDIDRLSTIETRQIFQLVKNLADFPNMMYLLAFDRNVVVETLEDIQKGDGNEYLEKIVQVPFELPLLTHAKVHNYFFNKLNLLIQDIPSRDWDNIYWGNIYHAGIKSLINNLREVTRLTNALAFSYGVVKGEANPVDLIAITALQLFEPSLYQAIRENKDLLLGEGSTNTSISSQTQKVTEERIKVLRESAINLSTSECEDLLGRLFPQLQKIFIRTSYGHGHYQEKRREKRICCKEHFDTFFNLALDEHELRESEVKIFVDLASDEVEFSSAINNYIENGKITSILERVQDYTESEIEVGNISTIVSVLLDVGEKLPEGPQGMLSVDNMSNVMRIINQLLKRIDKQEERDTIIKNAITKCGSLFSMVYIVGSELQEHDAKVDSRYYKPENERTVSGEMLVYLTFLVVSEIKNWAATGRLIKHPKMVRILYFWKRNQIPSDPKMGGFLDKIMSSPESVILFITAFLSKSYTQSGDNYLTETKYSLSLKNIGDFVETSKVEAILRDIKSGSISIELSDENIKALNYFLDTCDGKVRDDDW